MCGEQLSSIILCEMASHNYNFIIFYLWLNMESSERLIAILFSFFLLISKCERVFGEKGKLFPLVNMLGLAGVGNFLHSTYYRYYEEKRATSMCDGVLLSWEGLHTMLCLLNYLYINPPIFLTFLILCLIPLRENWVRGWLVLSCQLNHDSWTMTVQELKKRLDMKYPTVSYLFSDVICLSSAF